MTDAHPATEKWAEWWRKVDALRAALKKTAARGTTNVKAKAIREETKQIVQFYFREVRPQLIVLAISLNDVALIDAEMQEMIEIAARVTRVSTYLRSISVLNDLRAPTETAIEIAATTLKSTTSVTPTERAILETLDRVVPTTALSYQQVLQDLSDKSRVSFRGTASELREVLRELLDHLAPDSVVMQTGIKLESGQTKPTMKQKAAFILKARGNNETQRKTSNDAVDAVEGASGSLARSVYNRGSLATHLAATRGEVLTFKGYAEALLAELLEIHKA